MWQNHKWPIRQVCHILAAIVQLASLPVSVASWDFQKNPSWRNGVVDDESQYANAATIRTSDLQSVMGIFIKTPLRQEQGSGDQGSTEHTEDTDRSKNSIKTSPSEIKTHSNQKGTGGRASSITPFLQEGFSWKSQLSTLTGKLANCTISIRIPPSEGVGMDDEMFRAIMKRPIT